MSLSEKIFETDYTGKDVLEAGDVREAVKELKEKDWEWILYKGLGYRVTDDEEQKEALVSTICEIIDEIFGSKLT